MRGSKIKLNLEYELEMNEHRRITLDNAAHHGVFFYTKPPLWYKYGSGCGCFRCDVDLEEKAAEYGNLQNSLKLILEAPK